MIQFAKVLSFCAALVLVGLAGCSVEPTASRSSQGNASEAPPEVTSDESLGLAWSALPGATASCTVGNASIPHGSSYPSTDGCNRCTCNNGLLACSTLQCLQTSTAAGSCSVGSLSIPDGTALQASDGCNTCKCSKGFFACSLLQCAISKKSCVVENVLVGHGQQVPSASPGCNSCSCNDGSLTCSVTLGCKVGNIFLQNGKSLPARDGCNTCTCSNGFLACSALQCPSLK
jgi:hypothetical protein